MTIKVNETQEHAGVSDESPRPAQVDAEAPAWTFDRYGWFWRGGYRPAMFGLHESRNDLTRPENLKLARHIITTLNSHASLIAERDALLKALNRIAYEPQGDAEASHREVLEAVEQIAKDALAASSGTER